MVWHRLWYLTKHFVSFNLTTTKMDPKEMGLFPKHLMIGERKSTSQSRNLSPWRSFHSVLQDETENQTWKWLMVGGTTAWADCLDMHILGPLFELWPHFMTLKKDLRSLLGSPWPSSQCGHINKSPFSTSCFYFGLSVGLLRTGS